MDDAIGGSTEAVAVLVLEVLEAANMGELAS